MSDSNAGKITLDELNAMPPPRPAPRRAAREDALWLHLNVCDLNAPEVYETAAECERRS